MDHTRIILLWASLLTSESHFPHSENGEKDCDTSQLINILNVLSFFTLTQRSLVNRTMFHETDLYLDGSKLFSEVMGSSGFSKRILGCLVIQAMHEIICSVLYNSKGLP